MTSPPTHVSVAGLLVPVEYVPSIIAAIRAQYPTVTEGKGDDAAVRAFLKHVIATTWATHQASLALAPAAGAVEQVRAQYTEAASLARQQALAAAASIEEVPGPDEEV